MFATVKNKVITGVHAGSKMFPPTSPYYNADTIDLPDGASVNIGDTTDFYDSNWLRKTDAELINEKLITKPDGYVLDGDYLRAMTKTERIIAGLDAVPSGYKISDNKLVEMSIEEKIVAKIVPVPNGYKIDGDKVLELSVSEKVAAGLLSIPAGYKIVGNTIVAMSAVEKITAGLEDLPAGYKIVDDNLVQMSDKEKLDTGLITQEQYTVAVKSQVDTEINRRLSAINTTENQAKAIVDNDFAIEFKAAISAVLAVKKQSGYPLSVDWTGIPDSI
jgi:hypothetical protein